MLECIYSKRYGGKFFCCHTWKKIYGFQQGQIIIEQSKCVECGKVENTILIEWIPTNKE